VLFEKLGLSDLRRPAVNLREPYPVPNRVEPKHRGKSLKVNG
jgi:hypothetical protein